MMGGFAGIISSALAGGAGAVEDTANQQIVEGHKVDLMQQTQQAELDKLKQAEAYRMQLEDQHRGEIAARVNAAQSTMANGIIGQKYTGSDQAVAAANSGQTDAPMTQDQMDAIQQSKNLDQQTLMHDPGLHLAAAAQTGDWGIDSQATSQTRLTAAEARADALKTVGQDRLQGTMYAADAGVKKAAAHDATLKSIAKDKYDGLGSDDKAVHNEVVSNNVQINRLSISIDKARSDMAVLGAAAQADAAKRIAEQQAMIDSYRKKNDALFANAKNSRALRSATTATTNSVLFDPSDVPDASSPAPASDPAAPAAAPADFKTTPAASPPNAAGVSSALAKLRSLGVN
jgi:hypothetical protein